MHWPAVVLPPSNAAWLAQQPDSVLSGQTPLDDLLGLDYIAHGPSAESCRDFTVLRRDLTRQVVKLNDQTCDEVQHACDDVFGFGTEFRDFKALQAISSVSFHVANRVFVGLPMCRDKKYKKAVDRWTVAFGISCLFVRYFVPSGFKPLIMRLIAIPARLLMQWTASFITPAIRQRLAAWADRYPAPENQRMKPNDMIQWIIDANANKPDPAELDPANIAGKTILLNLFATGTTSTMTTVTLLHLLAHPHATTLLDELRQEAEEVLPRLADEPQAIREMVKVDSVLRETLRYHPLGAQNMIREVLQPGGVVTPDGLHLLQGTHVQIVVSNMQRDKEIWGDDADEYDPLRFYKRALDAKSDDNINGLHSRQKMAVQLSEDFLSFGLGRHACPGRFFAVHVMKLILGYLLVNYDLEPLPELPRFTEIGEGLIPDGKTVIRARRRETS